MAEPAVDELKKADEDLEIVWRAFELRPEPVPTLPPGGEYLQTVWTNSVHPLAERLGMKMNLPPVQPRSRRAHEAAHWARTQNRFDEYNEALFRAFFERGEDIGETETLLQIAESIDLDKDALERSLAQNEFLESVLADEREAEMLGVSGVPAFVANREVATTGVPTLENLQKLLAHARNN